MLRYTYNKKFFLKESAQSFYWAGFLAADGCIKDPHGSKVLSLCLAKKDEGHLKKFKEAIKFKGPISREKRITEKGTRVESVRISLYITKTNMIKDLERFNIVPRKTFIYSFPKWLVSHRLVNHFIRGYFDGDGYVGIKNPSPSDVLKKRKWKKLIFGLRGTIPFLEICQNILMKNCNIKIKHKTRDTCANVGNLKYCGNRVLLKIADFLYYRSRKSTRLKRKYDKFYSSFAATLPKKFIRVTLGVKAINKKTGRIYLFSSVSKAIKKLNISQNEISGCATGKRKSSHGFLLEYIR